MAADGEFPRALFDQLLAQSRVRGRRTGSSPGAFCNQLLRVSCGAGASGW